MAYTAYERTAGLSALQMVQSIQRQYTSGGTFSTASTPTLAEVETFLTMGSSELAAMLTAKRYTEAQTAVGVLIRLEAWNVLAACWWIELSRPSAGGAAAFSDEEPVSRLSAFAGWRKSAKDTINAGGLDELGAGRDSTTGVTVGGISISDKQEIQDDSDYQPTAFTRDKFTDPGNVVISEADQTPV